MPASVGSKSETTFYRRSETAPVHKEWGVGCRVEGVSLLGFLSTETGVYRCFFPYILQNQVVGGGGGFTRYFDLYSFIQLMDLDGQTMSLHPGLVPRLNLECLNWGKYVYRSCALFSRPQSSTVGSSGWVAGLTHDVSWLLNNDQQDSFSAADIATLGAHDNGAFYEAFNIRLNDYRGDRTWATTLPVVDSANTVVTKPPSSLVWPYIEASYQHSWAITKPDNEQINDPGFKGYVYLKYTVDFYNIKSDTSTIMQPMTWDGVTLGSADEAFTSFRLKSHPGLPPKLSRPVGDYKSRNTESKERRSVPVLSSKVQLPPKDDSKDQLPLSKPVLRRSTHVDRSRSTSSERKVIDTDKLDLLNKSFLKNICPKHPTTRKGLCPVCDNHVPLDDPEGFGDEYQDRELPRTT
jgi:hypothetical protein